MKIGLGCVNLGSAASSSSLREQVALVHRAIDGGISHFDTADAYASGVSERVLGRALRQRRDHVTISTKGGYLFRERTLPEQSARKLAIRVRAAVPRRGADPTPVNSSGSGSSPANRAVSPIDDTPRSAPPTRGAYSAQDFSPLHLRQAVEASLRRLQTDHIDVFLLHGPPDTDGEIFTSLNELRSSGKVARFGVGAESIPSAAAWVGEPQTDVVQLPFGVLDVDARNDVFGLARSNNVEIWARGILGGGLLSAAGRDIGLVRDHPKRAQIERLTQIASDAGIGVDELAIRWVRTSPDIALALLGMSSAAHLDRNLQLAAMPPLPADIAELVEGSFTTAPTRSDGITPQNGER